MRIDIHSHVIPKTFLNKLKETPKTLQAQLKGEEEEIFVKHEQGYAYPLLDEFHKAEAKLEAMDRKGIDISVISPAPPLFYYWADIDLACEVAESVNDGIAQFVETKPQRLRGMATLPMQHPDAAIAEMERVVREYGFKAIEIGTSIEGVELANKKFRQILLRAQELGLFVFAHPYYLGEKKGLDQYYLTNLIGNPLDTVEMVAHLMFSGALDELKELKICLAHGGGFAPYQIGRLLHGYKVRNEIDSNSLTCPTELLKRFYFDSLLFEPKALRYLIDLVGADRICLGTDSPFDMADQDPVNTLDSVPNLTKHERQEICCGTAMRLLSEGKGSF